MGTIRTPLRFIGEGKGGTFNYLAYDNLNDMDHIPCIGTYGCKTCVGIYLQIDNERCFIAHINTLVRHPESGTGHDCSPEVGEELRQAVLKALREHAAENEWKPTGPSAPVLKYLVCPEPTTDACELHALEQPVGRVLQTGWYVLEAIKDFLDDRTVDAMTDVEGFIVDRNEKRSHEIPYDAGWAIRAESGPSGASNYHAVPMTGPHDWTFTAEICNDRDENAAEEITVRKGSRHDGILQRSRSQGHGDDKQF